jgi:hypothetical protein
LVGALKRAECTHKMRYPAHADTMGRPDFPMLPGQAELFHGITAAVVPRNPQMADGPNPPCRAAQRPEPEESLCHRSNEARRMVSQ